VQFTLPEQSDWCDNVPIHSYDCAPVLPMNVSRPYFLIRPQGVREKFGVWGRDYAICRWFSWGVASLPEGESQGLHSVSCVQNTG